MLKLIKYTGSCASCGIDWMLKMRGSGILVDSKNCSIDKSHMQIKCNNCGNFELLGLGKIFAKMIVVQEMESDL